MTIAHSQEQPLEAQVARAREAARAFPFVSIVMPCLNERQTVEICVRKALGWLQSSGTPVK